MFYYKYAKYFLELIFKSPLKKRNIGKCNIPLGKPKEIKINIKRSEQIKAQKKFIKTIEKLRKDDSKNENIQTNHRGGRKIRAIPFVFGKNKLSILYTFKKALNYGFRKQITKENNLKGIPLYSHKKIQQGSITIILTIDISNSTYAAMDLFSDFLVSLTKTFKKNNDHIGLIALQNETAQILNNPTHNYKTVLRNLKSLEIEGGSPLCDGFKKSLTMAKEEKRRNPKARSIVIVLSDCFPEPITKKFDNIKDEPVYKNIVLQSKQFKTCNIPLILIRPQYAYNQLGSDRYEESNTFKSIGDILAKDIKKASGGIDIPIKTELGEKRKAKNIFGFINQDYNDDLNKIFDEITLGL